jgi:1-acyl-sn-glycerol-3-phosphate acyltransferase
LRRKDLYENMPECIGLLAASIKVSIIPVRIKGTYGLLPPGVRFPIRGCISVHIGKASLVVSGKPQEIAAQLNEIITGL